MEKENMVGLRWYSDVRKHKLLANAYLTSCELTAAL